jgi:hypothetical protein
MSRVGPVSTRCPARRWVAAETSVLFPPPFGRRSRVFHETGTIKKIQQRQIAHNRLLVATILASLALPLAEGEKALVLPAPVAAGSETPTTTEGEEEAERERRWRAWEAEEAAVVVGIVD